MPVPNRVYNGIEVIADLKHYLIILVCFLAILILLNFTVFVNLSSGLMIFLDIVLCLCFVFVVGAVWDAIIKKRNENKESNNNQNFNNNHNKQYKNKSDENANLELNNQDENKN